MEFTWSTFFVFAAAVITLVATSFLIGIYLFFKDL